MLTCRLQLLNLTSWDSLDVVTAPMSASLPEQGPSELARSSQIRPRSKLLVIGTLLLCSLNRCNVHGKYCAAHFFLKFLSSCLSFVKVIKRDHSVPVIYLIFSHIYLHNLKPGYDVGFSSIDGAVRTVHEMHENRDDPLRCPVKLYEFYLSKW